METLTSPVLAFINNHGLLLPSEVLKFSGNSVGSTVGSVTGTEFGGVVWAKRMVSHVH